MLTKFVAVGVVSLIGFGCGTQTSESSAVSRQGADSCATLVVHEAADVSRIANCRSVDGDVVIEGSSLANLHGLEGIQRISGSLVIAGNANLTSLDGLDSLNDVGFVVIADNATLNSVSSLRNLSHAKGTTIVASPALTSLHGLESLRSLEGLVLTNTNLKSIEGLSNLEQVGDLILADNPRLESLASLTRLQTVENLDIEHNQRLSIMGPFGAVSSPCTDGVVAAHWSRVIKQRADEPATRS